MIQIPRPPLISISSITYIDSDGVEQTLSSSLYRVGTKSSPGRVTPAHGEVWPTTRNVTEAVTITFLAGFGTTAATVPGVAKRAIRLTLGNWFENRESVVVGTIAAELPQSAKNLLTNFRMGRVPGQYKLTATNVG